MKLLDSSFYSSLEEYSNIKPMINNKLSVVILTYNEENNIEKCLQSIIWADEIILIDNSTDKTTFLAKQFIPKIKIIHETNSFDFAYLRNLGLQQATNNWVLFLDADEVISNDLQKEIKQQINKNIYDGFYLSRKDYFMGDWLNYGETAHISLLKLGKKTLGKWERAVHETWKINGNLGKLKHPLYHYPHPTIAEFITRINRWTDLDAQVFYSAGIKSSFIKIFIYPKAKFIKNYFWLSGYRDGMRGLIFAIMMSFHSFLTRAKLYILERK